jgi:hypothetical protein
MLQANDRLNIRHLARFISTTARSVSFHSQIVPALLAQIFPQFFPIGMVE